MAGDTGLTRKQLVASSGISANTINKYIGGKVYTDGLHPATVRNGRESLQANKKLNNWVLKQVITGNIKRNLDWEKCEKLYEAYGKKVSQKPKTPTKMKATNRFI